MQLLMYCNKCGKLTDEADAFCRFCGQSLAIVQQPQPLLAPQTSSGKPVARPTRQPEPKAQPALQKELLPPKDDYRNGLRTSLRPRPAGKYDLWIGLAILLIPLALFVLLGRAFHGFAVFMTCASAITLFAGLVFANRKKLLIGVPALILLFVFARLAKSNAPLQTKKPEVTQQTQEQQKTKEAQQTKEQTTQQTADEQTRSPSKSSVLTVRNGKVYLEDIDPSKPETPAQLKAQKDFEELTKRAARRAYAQAVQEEDWRSGVECKVRTQGVNDTTLYFKYILIGDSFRFKFGEEFVNPRAAELREMGFKKIYITNGVDHAWEWVLTAK
jgi:hypothetical protein